jgi:hypothetical protein
MSNGAGGRSREHNGHGNPLPGAAFGCSWSFCWSAFFCSSAFAVAGSDPAACSAGAGGAAGSAAAAPVPKSSALRLTAPARVAPATMSLKFKITPTVDCAYSRCGRGECRCEQSDFGSLSRRISSPWLSRAMTAGSCKHGGPLGRGRGQGGWQSSAGLPQQFSHHRRVVLTGRRKRHRRRDGRAASPQIMHSVRLSRSAILGRWEHDSYRSSCVSISCARRRWDAPPRPRPVRVPRLF